MTQEISRTPVDWSKPNTESPWYAKQRWRLGSLVGANVSVILLMIVALYFTVFVLTDMFRMVGSAGLESSREAQVRRAVTVFSTLMSVGLGMMLLFVVIGAWRSIRREGRVLRAVPANAGYVCPCCLSTIAREERATCSCGLDADPQVVQRFWNDYPFIADKHDRKQPPSPIAQRTILDRRRGVGRIHSQNVRWIIFGLVCVLVYGAVLLAGADPVRAARKIGWLATLGVGAGLIMSATSRPEATGQHCGSCAYQCEPGGDRAQCPECGADWTTPGALLTGVRRGPTKPVAMTVGVILIIAMLLWDLL